MPHSVASVRNTSARGLSSPMAEAAEARLRKQSNTRLPIAARSPDPAKRWPTPQSFSASDAGRLRSAHIGQHLDGGARAAPWRHESDWKAMMRPQMMIQISASAIAPTRNIGVRCLRLLLVT